MGEMSGAVIALPGDVFHLGRHRLLCGDATQAGDVSRLMDGVCVDLLMIDPPYNVDYQNHERQMLKYRVNERFSGERARIANDKMSEEEFIEFLAAALGNADTVMRPGATYYVWYSDLRAYSFHGALRTTGWKLHENLIWCKNRLTLGRYDYQWKHESCLYGWKLGGEHTWASDRKQTTLLEFGSTLRNKLHPNMKPVELFEYCIRNSTNPGDAVLDVFAGSGTTLIACERCGRKAFCMEIEPRYVETIVRRYVEQVGNVDGVYVVRDGRRLPVTLDGLEMQTKMPL